MVKSLKSDTKTANFHQKLKNTKGTMYLFFEITLSYKHSFLGRSATPMMHARIRMIICYDL